LNLSDSQNFIHNIGLAKKIVNISGINNEDLVLEIGPGKGILTSALAETGCQIIAVEYDTLLAEELKKKYKHIDNVKIISGNILKFDLPNTQYKVLSNIPFNLTADILSKLFNGPNLPTDVFLIMQYEAFLKYAGKPYYSNSMKSLYIKPLYNSEILYRFKKSDFNPLPNANIVLAFFKKKDKPDIEDNNLIEYKDLVSYLFVSKGQNFKEKTKDIFSSKQQLRVMSKLNIDNNQIISDWDFAVWLEIFSVYLKYVSTLNKQKVKNSYKRLIEQQSKLQKLHRNRRYKNKKNNTMHTKN